MVPGNRCCRNCAAWSWKKLTIQAPLVAGLLDSASSGADFSRRPVTSGAIEVPKRSDLIAASSGRSWRTA